MPTARVNDIELYYEEYGAGTPLLLDQQRRGRRAHRFYPVCRRPAQHPADPHHPIGDRTGADLLAMRVLDVTVHAWDLARALNVDDALDSDAVEFALAHTEVIEAGRAHGSFAIATGPPSVATSPQARLLHLAGRSTEGGRS